MSNLNELNIPLNADEATDWAARREYGLRWDAYHGGLVRDAGLREMYVCHTPEQAWIDMLSDAGHSVKV